MGLGKRFAKEFGKGVLRGADFNVGPRRPVFRAEVKEHPNTPCDGCAEKKAGPDGKLIGNGVCSNCQGEGKRFGRDGVSSQCMTCKGNGKCNVCQGDGKQRPTHYPPR